MALFHFNAQVLTRSSGHNAVAASAYRAGQRLTCARTGMVFNYTRKREVEHREIFAPDGAPLWVFDRAQLWNGVEQSESRKNSQVAREIEVALPIELTRPQQIELLRGFIGAQFVTQGMVADLAVHAKAGNPHAHVLLSLRALNRDGFGSKRRDWNDPAHVGTWRAAWAMHCNRALAAAGHATTVDHRSLAEQGEDRAPTIHVGRVTAENVIEHESRKAWNTFICARNELTRIQAQARRVCQQLSDITSKITEISSELFQTVARRATTSATPPGFFVPGEDKTITPNGTNGCAARALSAPESMTLQHSFAATNLINKEP